MYRQLLLHEMMREEINRLTAARNDMESHAGTLPLGSISRKRGKIYHSYRDVADGKQHMSAFSNPRILNDLKVRRKIRESLAVLDERIRVCSRFLEEDTLYDPMRVELELPEHYRGGKCPHLWLPGDVDPEAWANAEYPSNPMKIENPKQTNGGRNVRSKSESIVGTVAEEVKLLHRYEQQIIIKGEVFYPDFIFLLPETRRLIYYEHFGRMDDPFYVKRAEHKMEMYSYYGLYLGYNFFVTFETQNSSFSFPEANAIINRILELDRPIVPPAF